MLAELIRYFLVGCAAQGLVLAFLLWTRKANSGANRYLGVLVLIVSVQSVLSAFDTRAFFMAFPHLSKIGWLLPLFVGPLFFLFARRLSGLKAESRMVTLLHFLPAATGFVSLLPYYAQSAAQKRAYLDDFERASRDDFGFMNQFSNFQFLFYLVLVLALLRKHRLEIVQKFSEIAHIRLQWLRNFTYSIFVILFVGMIGFYAKKFGFESLSHLYDYHLHYVLVAVLLYWIGYHTLVQPQIFGAPDADPDSEMRSQNHTDSASETPLKYSKSLLPGHESDRYLDQLLRFMQTREPFKIPTLTIQELSDQTGIPKHHLSQVINVRLGKNFYDFINSYRVDEAKRLLILPESRNLTQIALSEEAGFNSKATFHAVFKKHTGLTPSAYAKQQRSVA